MTAKPVEPYRHLGAALKRLGVPLAYETARHGNWWVDLPAYVWPLRMYEYVAGVWRITVSTSSYWNPRCDSVRRAVLERVPHSSMLEVSFDPEELDTIAAWVVRNVECPVAELPDWLEPKWEMNMPFGRPFDGYIWSKAGAAAYERYAEGRRQRAAFRLEMLQRRHAEACRAQISSSAAAQIESTSDLNHTPVTPTNCGDAT